MFVVGLEVVGLIQWFVVEWVVVVSRLVGYQGLSVEKTETKSLFSLATCSDLMLPP